MDFFFFSLIPFFDWFNGCRCWMCRGLGFFSFIYPVLRVSGEMFSLETTIVLRVNLN